MSIKSFVIARQTYRKQDHKTRMDLLVAICRMSLSIELFYLMLCLCFFHAECAWDEIQMKEVFPLHLFENIIVILS